MMKRIVVFGGSGFIGSSVVRCLIAAGHMVKVVSRNPDKASYLKVLGSLGQVALVRGDVRFAADIERHIAGFDVVINLVGAALYAKDLYTINVEVAALIAKYAKSSGVSTLIHFSAMGIEDDHVTEYSRTKLKGEKCVLDAFPDALIVRPSLVFGSDDRFFTKFARLLSITGFLPLIGGGKTFFQPIYVVDLAKFVSKLVETQHVKMNIFNVGGSKLYTMRGMLKLLFATIGKRQRFLYIPFSLAYVVAFFCQMRLVSFMLKPFLGTFEPIVTVSQVKMLQYMGRNRIYDDLEKMGICATPLENIVPHYLKVYLM